MFKAVNNKIFVQMLKREKTQGGLLLPGGANEPQSYGKVLSFGSNVSFLIEEGDVLVFHPRGGMDMLVEKCIMKVLNSEEVYGIVTDEKVMEGLVPILFGE
jgi:co-chaperonin GroES (HSP10)